MSKTAAEAFTSQDVRNRVELLTDDEARTWHNELVGLVLTVAKRRRVDPTADGVAAELAQEVLAEFGQSTDKIGHRVFLNTSAALVRFGLVTLTEQVSAG